MEIDTDLTVSTYQKKSLFAIELCKLAKRLLDFYIQQRFFFIPNDLLEALSSMIGYYLADSYSRDSEEYTTGLVIIKDIMKEKIEKGHQLANLFREYHENLVPELKAGQFYTQTDLLYALTVLDINQQVSALILNANKELSKQHPSEAAEFEMQAFVRQQLYLDLQKYIAHDDSIEHDQPSLFYIKELSCYLGWIAGFYANLLDSATNIFLNYLSVCIKAAADNKNQH